MKGSPTRLTILSLLVILPSSYAQQSNNHSVKNTTGVKINLETPYLLMKTQQYTQYLTKIARNFVDKKEFEKSLIFYYQALQTDPNNADLLIEIARVEGWLNHHQKAIELLEKVLKVAPQRRDDVLRPLGWQYIENKQAGKAISFFTEYLKKHPSDDNATKGLAYAQENLDTVYLKAARYYAQQKQYEAALLYYYKTLEEDPDDTDLLIEIARVEGFAHNYNKAIQLLKKVLILSPQRRMDVLRPLAWNYALMKEYSTALSLFQEYLKTNPTDGDAKKGVRYVYAKTKQPKTTAQVELPKPKFSVQAILPKPNIMQPQVVNKDLVQARALVDKKQYLQALAIYYRILKKEPKNSDLLIEIARVEGFVNNHKKAIQLLQTVLQIAPHRREDVLRPLAWQYAADDKFELAIDLFNQYLKKHPNDNNALNGIAFAKKGITASYLKLARELLKTKQFKQALIYYYFALKDEPTNTDLLIETARVEGWDNNHKEAIQLLQQVLRIAPNRRDDILRPLAWQYAQNGNPYLAIRLFEEFLKKHKDDKDAKEGIAYSNLAIKNLNIKFARQLVDKKQYKPALVYYYKALSLAKNDTDLLIEIARVEGWVNNHVTAIQLLQRVLKIAPKRRDDVLRPLGWAYANNKQFNRAINLFNEYLAKHPNDKDAFNGWYSASLNLARKLADDKQYLCALCIYEVLNRKKYDIDIFIEMGRVYGWADLHANAIAIYQRVMEIAPQKTDDVLRPLAWQMLWNKEDPALSIKLFRDYLGRHPCDSDALLGIASSFETAENYRTALCRYSAIVACYPKKLDARYGKARMYLNLNRYYDAETEYCKILRIKPTEKSARENLALTHSWGKQQRRGALEFMRLIAEGDVTNDNYINLAHAEQWSGFSDLALRSLRHVTKWDKDLVDFQIKLLRDEANPLAFDYDFSEDSDTLHINSYRGAAGYRVKNTEFVFGLGYRHANFRQKNFTVENEFFANMDTIKNNELWPYVANRFGGLGCYGTHWASLWVGYRQYGNWHNVGWILKDKWVLNDKLNLLVDARNEVIENLPSILNRVLYVNESVGFEYLPNARLFISSWYTYGRFNDGNIRRRIGNRLEYTIFFNPKISIGWDTYYFNDSNPNINRGYYNPAEYFEAQGFLIVEKYFSKPELKLGFLGTQGRFSERPGQVGDLNHYEMYVEKDLKRYGYLRFFYGWSHSLPSLNAPATGPVGYWRRYLGLSYTVGL